MPRYIRKVGDINEDFVLQHYSRLGYNVWAPIKPKWGKVGTHRTRDILSTFDVIATNENDTIFIQVKTGAWFSKEVEQKILNLPMNKNIIKEYWTFWKDDMFRVRRYTQGVVQEYQIDMREL